MTLAQAKRLPADVQSTLVARGYCCGVETRCNGCYCRCNVAWWEIESEAHEPGCVYGAAIDEILGRQMSLGI